MRTRKPLIVEFPYLKDEFIVEKNPGIDINTITAGSNLMAWWRPPCGHVYQTRISNKAAGGKCPFCSGQRLLRGFNDIATTNPWMIRWWHDNRYSPEDLMPNSHIMIHFKCPECGYEFDRTPNQRMCSPSCPRCNAKKRISLPECAIFYYLREFAPDIIQTFKDLNFELDLYIPSLKIGIEYDGGYYHKSRVQKDLKKNQKCLNHGITLYRVREELASLNDTSIDIIRGNHNLPETLDVVIEELIFRIFNIKTEIHSKENRNEILELYHSRMSY